RSGCSFCMYRFTPFGHSLPRLNGKSSRGSNPTTLLFLTLRLMPHCCPQKQQCVGTSLSGISLSCQPPGGTKFSVGPYCLLNSSTVRGGFAIFTFLPASRPGTESTRL